MKHNKSTQFERATKMAAYDNLETDVENARKALEHKQKYLSESNHVPVARLRGKRSSEGSIFGTGGGSGSGYHNRGKYLNKQGTRSEIKEGALNMPCIRTPAILTLLQSPRRNGLSPREDDDEEEDGDADAEGDEDEVRKLQMEFEHQLQQGNGNGVGHRSIQVGAVKQLNRPTYSCSSCGARFHIKSLLGAHRRTHDDDFKVRFRERRMREREQETAKTATAKTDNKQCKFCDRIFDLERAMRIHQLCHCTRITPQQRRKLGYTDLAHEKKNAPLPSVRRLPKSQVLPLYQPVPDPSMPHVALGPAAIKMIEQEQQQLLKAKRRTAKYTVKVAGPLGRWR